MTNKLFKVLRISFIRKGKKKYIGGCQVQEDISALRVGPAAVDRAEAGRLAKVGEHPVGGAGRLRQSVGQMRVPQVKVHLLEQVLVHAVAVGIRVGWEKPDVLVKIEGAAEGEISGCISLNSDQPNAFDAQDLQFFSVIGYQMAATLKHFQRFSSVKSPSKTFVI
jgi:hypothetical protein